jgi:hypothetical protein
VMIYRPAVVSVVSTYYFIIVVWRHHSLFHIVIGMLQVWSLCWKELKKGIVFHATRFVSTTVGFHDENCCRYYF